MPTAARPPVTRRLLLLLLVALYCFSYILKPKASMSSKLVTSPVAAICTEYTQRLVTEIEMLKVVFCIW